MITPKVVAASGLRWPIVSKTIAIEVVIAADWNTFSPINAIAKASGVRGSSAK